LTTDREAGQDSSTRAPRLRAFVWCLLLALVIGVTVGGCGARTANGASEAEAAEAAGEAEGKSDEAGEDTAEKAPIPVEVVRVDRGEISSYLSATANLVAENQVQVLSEAQGRVRRVLVEEGDFVAQGQALAYLVRDDAEIALEKAQVRQNNAERAYERSRDLADKELISREDFDSTTLDFEVTRQEVAEAEWQLAKTTIRAPFGGRVSERMVQSGQHVSLNDPLFQVTDFDPLIARIFLPEADVIGLEVGVPVRVALNADPSVEFEGRIRQISPIVDTSTGTVKVTVEVSKPPSAVRPGSFVGIHIVRETRQESIVIPMDAVIRELQKAYVFVVEGDSAKKRDLELGLQEGERVEVLTGVDEGEQLIVAGQGGLKDDSLVKILDSDVGSGEAG